MTTTTVRRGPGRPPKWGGADRDRLRERARALYEGGASVMTATAALIEDGIDIAPATVWVLLHEAAEADPAFRLRPRFGWGQPGEDGAVEGVEPDPDVAPLQPVDHELARLLLSLAAVPYDVGEMTRLVRDWGWPVEADDVIRILRQQGVRARVAPVERRAITGRRKR